MIKIACLSLLLMVRSIIYAASDSSDSIWVGIYVSSPEKDRKESYWMGKITTSVYSEIIDGRYSGRFFVLGDACFWESEKIKNGAKRWFVKAQKDKTDSGTMAFRIENLNRIILLNEDPAKHEVIKDKNGNEIELNQAGGGASSSSSMRDPDGL